MIRVSIITLGLVGVVFGETAVAGDPVAGKARAQQCVPCHGIDGVAKQPNVPNIGGESEMYLTKQLKAFRSGERKDEQMSLMAQPLSDEDIANLVAWYSSIEFTVKLPP